MNPKPLYELKQNSPLRVFTEDGAADLATFHHIDGIYSYCTTSDGEAFHLSATTPMKFIDGRWEINNPSND